MEIQNKLLRLVNKNIALIIDILLQDKINLILFYKKMKALLKNQSRSHRFIKKFILKKH